MAGIRSTKTYIWYLKDVLGTGATSSVYMGRNKKSGDIVAVKMFNHMSYMRPQDVRQREFEVLLKLDHSNIIHLLAIEDDQISKHPVIIMEMCTGGSLHNHLDMPENLFGLKEKDFLAVLKDVSAGMKHLRDRGIVHRDIKPGNIMIVRGDDGIFVYKLADFGAARELDDDEAFMSLYGTEEYLHPDLYKRAVLGNKERTKFTAQTDLWSLGVTFYQTASGCLPFRPYGGRSNREVMHKITTTKKTGMISGVQDAPNAPIIWSDDLPKTCHLSPQLRLLIKELLANTMECNMSLMWTFEQFFDYVQEIMSFRAIDVFVAHTCDFHKIYVAAKQQTTFFQAKLAHLTGMQPDTQCLLWENLVLDTTKCSRCEDLPQTTPDNPLILLRIRAEAFPGIRLLHLPAHPKTATHYNVSQDAVLAKKCAAVMCHYADKVEGLNRTQYLITQTVRAVINVLKTDYLKSRSQHSLVRALVVQSVWQLKSVERSIAMFALATGGDDQCSSNLGRLRQMLTMCQNRASALGRMFKQATDALDIVEKTAINDDYLSSQWEGIRQQHILPEDRVGRLKVLAEGALHSSAQFKKDKQGKQLSYNEEQIHRMDKEKLSKNLALSKKIFEELFDVLKQLHKNFGTWHGVGSDTRRFQDELVSAQLKMSDLPYEYNKLISEICKVEEEINKFFSERFDKSRAHENPSSQQPSQEMPETAEITTSITPSFAPISRISGSPHASPPDMAGSRGRSSLMLLYQEFIKSIPVGGLGMVPVPRPVKQTLQGYESGLKQLIHNMDGERDVSSRLTEGCQVAT